MKRFVYSVALVTAIMFGFSSCEEDEETTKDLRDEIVGTYSCTIDYVFSEDGVNYNLSLGDTKIVGELVKEYSAVSISKEGDDIAIKLSSDGTIIGTSFNEMGLDGVSFNIKDANVFGAKCSVEKCASPYDCVYETYLEELYIKLVADINDVQGIRSVGNCTNVMMFLSLEKK